MKMSVRIIRTEQGDYMAVCTSLPGCVSRGQSRDEAMQNLDTAIRGYMAAVNNFVPENFVQEVAEV